VRVDLLGAHSAHVRVCAELAPLRAAGRDTTACLMTWMVYHLSDEKDSENQRLFLDEAKRLVGLDDPYFDVVTNK
jgi:hypothetical protein